MTINLINSSSAHFGAVRLVAFDSSNEKLISIGEEEGRLYVWNTDTLSPSTGSAIEKKTEDFMVRSAVFPSDFSFIFGGNNNKLICADWPDCNDYTVYITSENEIDFISSKWDTNTIAYSDQHTIHFYDKENTNYPELKIESTIKWMNFSRNAKYLAISSSDSTILIWNASDFSEIFRKKFDLGSSHPSWGPGDFLLIPVDSSPGTVVLINVDKLEEHQVQNPLDDLSTTTEIALSNNYILAIADVSQQISFFQLNEDYSLTHFSTTKYSGSELSSLSFGNLNTNLVAAGDTEGTLFLFELIDSKKSQSNKVNLAVEEQSNDESKENQSEPTSKTINDVLKDKPILISKTKKPQKKIKGKGKQQKLNLAEISTKTKKIESKRKFVSDHSSSSYSENEEGVETKKTKSFLNEDDENLDDIEELANKKPKKTFLNDDDDDDDDDDNLVYEIKKQKIESPKKTKKSFLLEDNDDDLDEIIEQNKTKEQPKDETILNDDGVPGYDDIALPDDEDDIESLDNDDKNKELLTENKAEDITKESNAAGVYNAINYLDYSSSTRFMPGSFKQRNGKTEILCWNGEGSIVMYGDLDSDKYVEICPYGNSTFLSERFDDEAYKIILATVDEYGYLLSTNNVVIYRQHNESDPIVKSFPFLDDIQLIACGNSFFAVATYKKYLHIFSSVGIELTVFSLTGRLITMVGHENYLFVVSGKHHFDLFDVSNRSLAASGTLPIHAPLRWVGFNHFDHSVIVQGGNYQLLSLSYSEGVRWTPVVDLSKHLDSSSSKLLPLFIVEVYGNQVSGIYLDDEEEQLETKPFPENLKDIDFEPPTIESLLDNCVLSIINYQNSNNKEKDAKRFDKDLLIQFDAALREDKLLLAYQIAEQMKTPLGIKLAIQICDQRGQSGVSERLIKLKDLKEEEEEYEEPTDFEIDESTEEPEPFVRTEKIENDEEDTIQKTNAFLDKFKTKDQTKENAKNDDSDESDTETNKKTEKIKETESSEDDLDRFDDNYQNVSRSNSEANESFSKEIQKRTNKRKTKENQNKTSKSKNKITSKSRNKADFDDENEFENDQQTRNDENEIDENESNSENDEVERKEKKKKKADQNEKKKPVKPKPTRKKLFNRKEKPANMSALDAFGFS